MTVSDMDLNKIRGIIEETINGEVYFEKIKGVVEEAISGEKYLKRIGKLITVGVGEALEQVVFPKLDEIESKMATKEDIDKLGEIITQTRTNHERRIRNLEDEVGAEPRERLTL